MCCSSVSAFKNGLEAFGKAGDLGPRSEKVGRHEAVYRQGNMWVALETCPDLTRAYPYAPCMEYLPTFNMNSIQTKVHILYMEHMGYDWKSNG